MRWLVASFLGLVFAGPAGLAQSTYERIDFCGVLKNSERYADKEVTVRATYKDSFEVSSLYCLSCPDQGNVWLDFSRVLDDESKAILRSGDRGRIKNLTVTGAFRAGGTYGHMNAYKYQIEARKVRDLVVLLKGLKSVEKVRAVEKKWACGGENPK